MEKREKPISPRPSGYVRSFNDYIAGTSTEKYSVERDLNVTLGGEHKKLRTVPPSDKYL